MQFEFVCGRTREELDEKVERMIAAGWKRFTGDVHVIPSGITSDHVEVPNLVYFLQSVIKKIRRSYRLTVIPNITELYECEAAGVTQTAGGLAAQPGPRPEAGVPAGVALLCTRPRSLQTPLSPLS